MEGHLEADLTVTPSRKHSSLSPVAHPGLLSSLTMSLVEPLPQFANSSIVKCLITCLTFDVLKQA